MPDWYVKFEGGDAVGPLSTERVVEGILSTRFPLSASVAPLGSDAWTALSSVEEFAAAIRSVAPPPGSSQRRAEPATPQALSLGEVPVKGSAPKGIRTNARRGLLLVAGVLALVALTFVTFHVFYDPGQASYQRGLALEKEGRADEAIVAYKSAVDTAPDRRSGREAAEKVEPLLALQAQRKAAIAEEQLRAYEADEPRRRKEEEKTRAKCVADCYSQNDRCTNSPTGQLDSVACVMALYRCKKTCI